MSGAINVADILLIDAHCVLCNRFGSFLTKRLSKRGGLQIYGIDSEQGVTVVGGLPESLKEIDSMYLIRAGQPFVRSAASIRLLLYMRWYYAMWYPFAWLFPLPLRDGIYRIVSRYRHRLFGE